MTLTPRTSTTHPLRVDAVDAPGGGRIGMTLCPGRRDLLSVEGPWERDLLADLDVVAAWGPSLIFTLVELREFALLGVPEFPAAAAMRALPVRYLPIRDAGVPDATFETAWTAAGADARAVLRSGGRVLVHCRAGLGRTGMIAARLLVELGMPAEEAILNVRSVRPGAIETPAQERHVRNCGPAW